MPHGKAFTDEELAEYRSDPGFGKQVMIDLQRLFACLEADKGEDNIDAEYVAEISKLNSHFSGKIVLPMNSNTQWRTGSCETASES